MHFMWLIFLFWIKGHSMRGWLKPSTQKSHTGQPIECLRLLCLLKVRLFYYQYFTSASRETREMNCLLANGWRWRWRWDLDFQNKHRAQGLANKSLYTHTHTDSRAPMCCDLDLPQEKCFDWPAEVCDGLRNTLDAKGESCQEHRGMFYL